MSNGGFHKGDTRIENGVDETWDGSQWVPSDSPAASIVRVDVEAALAEGRDPDAPNPALGGAATLPWQAIRGDDGALHAFNQATGVLSPEPLVPAAPADPATPNISFHHDPNTGTFFRLDHSTNELTVVSERTPEGFEHILTAAAALSAAGLNIDRYDYVFEDGRVIPKLRETIPPTQSSFFTATDASGQLFVIDRTTGAAVPIGQTPSAGDVGEGTVTFDAERGVFKITQPNGVIDFFQPRQVPQDIQTPERVMIDGQAFAFNPNTGGFQQVQQPARTFDPGVVVQGGREFVQGPTGQLTPLPPEQTASLDDLINQRLIAGDAAGALALSDFRDRPDSLELAQFALQVAQSPGDVAAISAIARGQRLVEPPPQGEVRRIAQIPEFLQTAMDRLFNQLREGSATAGGLFSVTEALAKEVAATKEDLAAREEADRKQSVLDEANRVAGEALKAFAEYAPLSESEIAAQQSGTPSQGRSVTLEDVTGAPSGLTIESVGLVNDRVVPTSVSGTNFRGQTFRSSSPGGFGAGDISATLGRIPGWTQGPAPEPTVTPSTAPSAADAFAAFRATEARLAPEESRVAPTPQDVVPPTAPGRYAFFEHGGTTSGPNLEIVGEGGPELVDLPPGTRVIPLKGLSKKDVKKLREQMGIPGFQDGGTVEPLLPFGVRRAIAGSTLEPTRRRLLTAAGLPVLSAQAQQNISPEEFDVLARLSREAGISDPEFRRELRSALPGVNRFRQPVRSAPRVLR